MVSDKRTRLYELIQKLEDASIHDSRFSKLLYVAREVYDDPQRGDEDYWLTITAVEEVLSMELGLNKNMSHVSYAPLAGTIAKYKITVTALCEAIGLSAGVRTSLVNNQPVSTFVLNKIAMTLDCGMDDIVEFISESEARRRANFGKLIKRTPKLFETAITAQFNPDYGSEKPPEDSEEANPNYRNFAIRFNDIKDGYRDLFEFFDLSHDDYREWSGLAREME